MTDSHLSPEDAFDRWLDNLADGSQPRPIGEDHEAAEELHRLFSVAPTTSPHLNKQRKAAIRQQVLPQPASTPAPLRPSRSTGIIASAPPLASSPSWLSARRAISLVSAAMLMLIALASIGVVLRLDDNRELSGVSATASMMPFAPGSALASPTPMANCVTDDTLLLMPEERPGTGAFADLPFPVAWYWDGMLTIEQQDDVIREIEIGPTEHLQPTPWPDVAIAYSPYPASDPEGTEATLINIDTGTVFDIGAFHAPQWTGGPFMFWTEDDSYTHWHAVDLRTFEHVDLSERLQVDAPWGWIPGGQLGNSSDDGTVLFLSVNPLQPLDPTAVHATPSDLPRAEAGRSALLVNGSLDDISVVVPVDTTSGATALSPDGRLMAWLSSSEQGDGRILTVAETAGGDLIYTQPIEATYSNSLLFNRDGSILYSTSRTALNRIAILPDGGTPTVITAEPIPLPDTAYQIAAASPDRQQLLLARSDVNDDSLLWLDTESGETREFTGRVGRLVESHSPNNASLIDTHVLIFDLYENAPRPPSNFLNMETGEIVGQVENDATLGTGVGMIATNGSTGFTASQDGAQFIDLTTGEIQAWSAPEAAADSSTSFAITPDGSCAIVTWPTDGGGSITRLYSASSGQIAELPPSPAEGWVPGIEDNGNP